MAQRRMFSQKVTETDQFLDMALSAQALYFHLGMAADDDGFVGNPKSIKRMVGASDDDLKLLVEKDFLLLFADGVVAIKDWYVSNYIKKDRYTATIYSNDRQLVVLDNEKRYQLAVNQEEQCSPDGATTVPAREKATKDPMISPCHQPGTQVEPQDRLSQERVRRGKERGSLTDTSTSSEQIIAKFYRSLRSVNQKQELMQFINELGNEVVAFALNSMNENAEQPSFNYLRAILLRFKRQGIKTLQAAQHDHDVFNGKTVVNVNGPRIPLYKLGE